MNSYLSRLFLTFAFAWLGLFTIEGIACSCIGVKPPCQAYWEASAVFLGTVNDSATVAILEDRQPIQQRLVRFSLEEVFRGEQKAEAEVLTGLGGGDCGFAFTKGERYLVYAYHNVQTGKLQVSVCSRTRLLSEATEDLRYIRNLPEPGAGSSISGEVLLQSLSIKEESSYILKPLEGIKIIVEGQSKTLKAVTDKAGRYQIGGLEPGVYKIRADLPSNISSPSEFEVKVVDRGCAGIDFRASLNGQISGKVFDSNAQPLVGVKVDIIPVEEMTSSSPAGKWRFTNQQGSYQIDWIPPGNYLLGVNLIGAQDAQCPRPRTYYPGVSDPSQAKIISIGEGQELQSYDLRLLSQQPQRIIKGVVVWPDGRPATQASVNLANGTRPHYLIGKGTGTDEKGRFELKAAEGCSYRILAFTYGGRVSSTSNEMIEQRHAEPVTVRVTEGKIEPLKLVLSLPGFQHQDEEGRTSGKPSQKVKN